MMMHRAGVLLRMRAAGAGGVRLRLLSSSSTAPAAESGEGRKQAPIFLGNYLHDALYDARTGYLWNHVQHCLDTSRRNSSISGGGDAAAPSGVAQRPAPWPTIEFSKLATTWEYRKSTDEALRGVGASWLNPFELFNPWYGYALGKYLMEAHIGADATAAAAAAAAATAGLSKPSTRSQQGGGNVAEPPSGQTTTATTTTKKKKTQKKHKVLHGLHTAHNDSLQHVHVRRQCHVVCASSGELPTAGCNLLRIMWACGHSSCCAVEL